MKNLTRILAVAFLSAVAFFGAALEPARGATTFTVDTVADTNDLNAGDGSCLDSLGTCSLRAAAEESNALAGDDIINFSAGLIGFGTTLDAAKDSILITSNVLINGLGANNFSVSGGDAVRVFNITSGTATLRGLTVRNGKAPEIGSFSRDGGGGVRCADCVLTLENMVISNNVARDGGGGIYLQNVSSAIISSSSITGNSATFFSGGGILSVLSTLTMTDSNLTGNQAINTSNTFRNDGGGMIVFEGSLTMTDCSVAGNASRRSGGGASFAGGTHRISGTTFSGNNVTEGIGGGVTIGSSSENPNSPATVTMVNSTLSGNNASEDGGGISNFSSTSTLRNVTVASNTATISGGGIYNGDGAPIRLANTIVADNIAPTNPDVDGAINSLGNNLVRTRGTSTGYVATDLPDGSNPMLGALANNGGPTQTRALLTGSQAVNAGNNAQALDTDNATALTTDQRGAGFPRIVNGTVDIGAFESALGTTAALVSIGGRVLTSDGRGIRNARVMLTDSNGETRAAVTGKSGAYGFADVAAGETYVIRVFAKRFQFTQNTQVHAASEDVADINFVAVDEQR